MARNTLSFEGCNYMRQRLVLATLSGKSVKIKKIRSKDDNPGIRDFEASFIRLLDELTNGSIIEVNETGSSLFYQPGMLHGGILEHICNPERSIGYYLEALFCLAPFMKNPLKITLKGVTNDNVDPSVDLIKLSGLPVLKRFLGTDEGLEIKILNRGASPRGGGEVHFSCPSRQKLRPINLTSPGKIKRIRGVAWTSKVAPTTANRMVDSARSVLNQCLPDVYIYTDHSKGRRHIENSPGFGLTLVAETTEGIFLCSEVVSNSNKSDSLPPKSDSLPSVPEDVGKEAAISLLEEIYRGGCVDSSNQSLACLMMVLGQRDISKIQTGPLTDYTVNFLRHIKEFFNVTFKIDNERQSNDSEDGDDDESKLGGDKYILTCAGVGFTNLSKRLT